MKKNLKRLAGLGGLLVLALSPLAANAATPSSLPGSNNPDTLRDQPAAPQGAADTSNSGQPGNPSSTPTTTQSKPGGNTGDQAASPAAAGQGQNWSVNLNSSAKDVNPGERLFVDSQGRVFSSARKPIGHPTDTSGNRIDKVPSSGDYQIRNHGGTVIGQTQAGGGFDNAASLAPQESSK